MLGFVITVDLFCSNCPNWVVGGDKTKRAVIKRAKAQGWLIKKSEAFCPMCRNVYGKW